MNEIEDRIQLIKSQMPETYKSIKAKADVIGRQAYALVRRGLGGEVNCFYAFEAGHVVGTPFNCADISRDLAQLLVEFGCVHVCIFGERLQAAPTEDQNGTH
ncbi:MAG: hypothetical protein Q8N13_11075 [Acidovorax sp.]|nr:hypothetical protein [Acidovorax sp.]